jgi:hypothetical protein
MPEVEENKVAGAILTIFFYVMALCSPLTYSWPIVFWPFVGCATFAFKLWRLSTHHNLDWREELWLALKTPVDGMWACILLWPMELIRFAITRDFDSFVDNYRLHIGNQIFDDMVRNGAERRTAQDSRADDERRAVARERKRAQEFRRQVDEIPETVTVGARAAYACGLITTAAAGMSTTARAQTPSTNSGASVYGWVTVVGEATETTNSLTLRHARVRPTVTITPSLWLFGEYDLAELRPEQNWLKQSWVGWKPTESLTLRAGRLTLTPIALTPPPFKLETVNYPRLPFRVFAYGLQAEAKHGDWKIAADVSGTSGLLFDSDGQFDSLETTVRVERNLGRRLTLGGQFQAGDHVRNVGLDWNLRPTDWLTTKGAGYVSSVGETETIGGYAFLGIKPCPALEFYGQFDALRQHEHDASFIASSGVTLMSPGRRRSLTFGHEWRPDGGKRQSTFLLKAQLLF